MTELINYLDHTFKIIDTYRFEHLNICICEKCNIEVSIEKRYNYNCNIIVYLHKNNFGILQQTCDEIIIKNILE